MSLRARLLLAVGAIALVALVVADVATYSSLRSFLNDRVDQSLDTVSATVESGLGGRRGPGSGPGGPGSGPGSQPRPLVADETFVQLRDDEGRVIGSEPAGLRNGTQASPKLPDSIALPEQHGPDDVVYFTAPSQEAGGPEFRVRVSTR